MPRYTFLVAQRHEIDAATPEEAGDLLRARLGVISAAVTAADPGSACAWAPSITASEDDWNELLEILAGVVVPDEADPGNECNPYPGQVRVEATDVPERLMAWMQARTATATVATQPATA